MSLRSNTNKVDNLVKKYQCNTFNTIWHQKCISYQYVSLQIGTSDQFLDAKGTEMSRLRLAGHPLCLYIHPSDDSGDH